MEASAELFALLKRVEGLRLRPYLDAAGYPTIGWGHRMLHPESFPDGITEDLAEHMLLCDVDDAESAVNLLVKVPLTQGQFDALCDFTFNLGEGSLAHSTLLRDLNAGQYNAAARQLLLWDHAGAQEVEGLRKRRLAEFELWHEVPAGSISPAIQDKEALHESE